MHGGACQVSGAVVACAPAIQWGTLCSSEGAEAANTCDCQVCVRATAPGFPLCPMSNHRHIMAVVNPPGMFVRVHLHTYILQGPCLALLHTNHWLLVLPMRSKRPAMALAVWSKAGEREQKLCWSQCSFGLWCSRKASH